MPERDLVFFSYRHEDERWLKSIRTALEPYELGGQLLVWSDQDIRVGSRWHGNIQSALDRTRVGVVLLSQTFFGSEYIRTHELPRLVEDAQRGLIDLVCVPVDFFDDELLGPCGLAPIQFVHPPDAPLYGRKSAQRQQAVVQIAKHINKAYRRRGAELQACPPVRGAIRQAEPLAAPSSAASHGPAILHDVPPLDARHVPRDEALAHLKHALLQGTSLTTGLTSPGRGGSVGLHGMGGMGKTVLAQALCHDAEVRQAFPDGIFWVTLGQQPTLLEVQNRLLRTLDPQAPAGELIAQARERLAERLLAKRALLVIDDLWHADHFRPFDVAGGQGRVLITTRDGILLTAISAREHRLPPLATAQALHLLARWAGVEVAALPPPSRRVAELCGGLPLALALAGAQVADGVRWDTLAGQLERGKLEFLDHEYGSVYQSLALSVEALPAAEQACYLELAVFPEDARIPTAAIARLWRHAGSLDAAAVEKLLVRLDRKALLTLVRDGDGSHVVFHDLQHDFIRLRAADLAALNGLLLDAYRATLGLPDGATGWARLPTDESYLWPRLAAHRAAAGRRDELQALLLSLDWIDARLAAGRRTVAGREQADVHGLLGDYDALPSVPDAALVRRALQMSTHAIGPWPEQVGFQLYGRLATSASGAIRRLCANAMAKAVGAPMVPLRPALSPPGWLSLTLTGHSGSVSGALLLDDGRRALSWSDDGSLKLWDLERGEMLHSLVGHKASISGALLLDGGHLALSWSYDCSLKLWDLERGKVVHSLVGHEAPVSGALLLGGNRQALSWSDDRSLKLWDLERGKVLHSLVGHEASVVGALLLDGGRRALSWSDDHSLKLWDLERSKLLHSLADHRASISGALLLDGNCQALSWSDDHSLKLWDLERGKVLHSLVGHEASIRGALLLDGDHQALSWSYDRSLKLWDLERGEVLHSFFGHEDAVLDALLLDDGHRALSWSEDCSLKLWDLERGEVLHSLVGHEAPVSGALLLDSDRRALSWSYDRSLKLWDLKHGEVLHSLVGHEAPVSGALLLHGDRRTLSWSYDRSLKLWDLEQGEVLYSLVGHEASVRGALLLDGGRQVLSWSSDRSLKLWDLECGEVLHSFVGHEDSVRGALLLDSDRRALSWSHDRSLKLWDLEQGKVLHNLVGHEDAVLGVLLLDDGHQALSWSEDRSLKLWDLERSEVLHSLVGHKDSVGGVLLLDGSHQALSWSGGWLGDYSLKLWDLEQGNVLHSLAGHEDAVLGVLLLGGGHQALSWSSDCSLKLWDLERGEVLHSLVAHEDSVRGALLLNGGRRVLSWSSDRSLKLWDSERGRVVHSLVGHEASIRGALLLDSDRQALSWSYDRSLKLWNLEHGEMLYSLVGHEDAVLGALLLDDGRRALSWSYDHSLRLWDLWTGRQLDLYLSDAALTSVMVGLNGHRLFAGDAMGRIHCLHLSIGSPEG